MNGATGIELLVVAAVGGFLVWRFALRRGLRNRPPTQYGGGPPSGYQGMPGAPRPMGQVPPGTYAMPAGMVMPGVLTPQQMQMVQAHLQGLQARYANDPKRLAQLQVAMGMFIQIQSAAAMGAGPAAASAGHSGLGDEAALRYPSLSAEPTSVAGGGAGVDFSLHCHTPDGSAQVTAWYDGQLQSRGWRQLVPGAYSRGMSSIALMLHPDATGTEFDVHYRAPQG